MTRTIAELEKEVELLTAEAAVLLEALQDAVYVVGSAHIGHLGDHTSHIAQVETARVERWRQALTTAPERARKLLDVIEAARVFYACVIDDNGDVTVTTSNVGHEDWVRLAKRMKALDQGNGGANA